MAGHSYRAPGRADAGRRARASGGRWGGRGRARCRAAGRLLASCPGDSFPWSAVTRETVGMARGPASLSSLSVCRARSACLLRPCFLSLPGAPLRVACARHLRPRWPPLQEGAVVGHSRPSHLDLVAVTRCPLSRDALGLGFRCAPGGVRPARRGARRPSLWACLGSVLLCEPGRRHVQPLHTHRY